MKILTFDCATRSGWATNVGGVVTSTFTCERRKGESEGQRWQRYSEWLRRMLSLYRPDLVVYEQPGARHRSRAALLVAYALTTRVEEAAAAFGTRCESIPPAQLKKWATGSGNAEKGQMRAAAAVRYPELTLHDDNEADALLLLAWAQAGCPAPEPAPKKRRAKQC